MQINGASPEAPIIREQLEILKKTHNTTEMILKISIITLIVTIISLIITFIHIF